MDSAFFSTLLVEDLRDGPRRAPNPSETGESTGGTKAVRVRRADTGPRRDQRARYPARTALTRVRTEREVRRDPVSCSLPATYLCKTLAISVWYGMPSSSARARMSIRSTAERRILTRLFLTEVARAASRNA